MQKAQRTTIDQLWDELAGFDMAQADDALGHLLQTLCALLDAQRAWWLGAVRVDKDGAADPLHGWRPCAIRHLDTRPADLQIWRQGVRQIERGDPSEITVNHVRQAGSFRAVRLRDHVSEAFFASCDYEDTFRSRNLHDALYVVFPLNQDAESYYCFMRDNALPPFTPRERDLAGKALRGGKWFHRQVMLYYGLLIAGRPLTGAERQVLRHLLTAKPEKRIVEDLGLNPGTVHAHILAIYRKFGVSSRAGLMALWLGGR